MRYVLVISMIAALVANALWRVAPEHPRSRREGTVERTLREPEEIEIVQGAASVQRPDREIARGEVVITVGAPIRSACAAGVVRVLQRSARQTPAYSTGNPSSSTSISATNVPPALE